jgi:hypothetical protein
MGLRPLACTVCWLIIAAPVAVASASEINPPKYVDDVLRHASLIAHVRIAGELRQAERRADERLWLAEVLESALGASEGQLVIVAADVSERDEPQIAAGESMILFAAEDEEGLFRPLRREAGIWPINREGELQPHPFADVMPPVARPTTPSDAIAWLWGEAQQANLELSVTLNEQDRRDFGPERPLRLDLRIRNLGGRSASIDNSIEFKYHHHYHHREKLEEKRNSSLLQPRVVVVALAPERSLSQLQQALRSSSELVLEAGAVCAGECDLAQQPELDGGMRYALWAEIGGRRSQPISFDLPGGDEAMEKLEDLAEDDGPFRVVQRGGNRQTPMAQVESTDQSQAIQAALRACVLERRDAPLDGRGRDDDVRELTFLSRINLPLEFAAFDAEHEFVIADRLVSVDRSPQLFALRQGKASFRGRAMRVERVEVATDKATVEIGELRGEARGTLIVVSLSRQQGAWRVAEEIQLRQY